MNAMASQIIGVSIIYSTTWPVNSSHKGPVMRKMSPFDDVIMPHSLHTHSYTNAIYTRQKTNFYIF